MFNNINLKSIYRTKKDDFENEFIVPMLKTSKTYYRGTGFFNVKALVNISNGLIPYIKNGGIVHLITSVRLDFEEIKMLADSEMISQTRILSELEKEVEIELNSDLDKLNMDLITNLIAVNRIKIKVAYLPDGGLYHEKIGYFEDLIGNRVCFIGSNNETYAGTRKNAETISVIKSWEGGEEATLEQRDYFETLWDNNDEDIKVVDFPDAAKKKLFSKYKKSDNYTDVIEKIEEYYSFYTKSKEKRLYSYQEKAIEEFCENKYCHFFEMATGTGKTFTAVKAIETLSNCMGDKSLYVSVVVPQVDLQSQWKSEFDKLGIKNYSFGGNATSSNWEDDLSNSIIDYFNGEKIVVIISIFETFFSKVNDRLDDYQMNKILVVDEAHELSANQIPKLTDNFRFRLGLSATPERHDKNETKKIIDYFTRGKADTYKYSIDDAIKNGFLSKYEYHPIIVHLEDNDVEFGQYQKYTKRLAFLLNEKERDIKKIQEVCNNRSLIVKKARSKVDKIKEMSMDPKYDFKNAVVYCGMGKDLETEESIIDNVSKALGLAANYSVSQFTSKTVNRGQVLEEFENGYYDTLIAIKCFDQGVDVPKLDKIYIMASDSIARQTIQRRGRVLRICKETGKEIAYIYDMVTLPPFGIYEEIGASSLVYNELKRVKEYARLAENYKEIEPLINEIIDDYSITEESNDEKEIDY